MADPPATRFPRRCFGRRLVYSTEARVGSLPLVVLAPTVAALTAWAVSHPSLTIRRGLVVHDSPSGMRFGRAWLAASSACSLAFGSGIGSLWGRQGMGGDLQRRCSILCVEVQGGNPRPDFDAGGR